MLEKRRQLEFDEAGEFRRTEQGEQRAPDFTHYGGSSAAHYSYGGGGTYLGEFKEDGSINIRDTHFKPLDSETVAQSRSYTTQGGETLQNLAQMFLGDKDFWYLIAALNGLDSPDEALPQGKVLHIPAQGTASNSSDAFNPINLNEVLENYLPEAAFVPPPQKGCNAVASIIMIVVAVIATVYTAGAGAGWAAGLTNLTTTANLGAAFAGGVVGSLASQTAGNLLGVMDGFDLKGALVSGITTMATAGFSGALGSGGKEAVKGFSTLSESTGQVALTAAGKATVAAGASITSVAAGKLVGQQSSFRWGNVAASAVAAGIGGNTGIPGMDSFNPLDGMVQSGIRYGADKLFGNEASWNFDAVAVDAFGNALGNSIVSGLSTKSNQPGQLSPQTQRELEQAEKSGQVSAELARKVVEETSRGLSVGLKGSTLKVTDGKTDWGGDLNEMTSYGNLMTARRSLLSEFDMNSDSGRALDMGFMQMQAAQMRQMTQTPIEESAAYLQGMARGEARYNHINRDRIAQQQRQVQTTRQLDTLNKQTWQADQARAKMTTLEKVQLSLDVVGMTEIPVLSQLADLGSAGISAYNGDYVGAGISMGSMIPIAGKAFEGTRLARTAEQLAARAEAAANIRQARAMLRDAKVPLSAQHEIIRSFDMETFRVTTLSQDTQLYRFFDDAGKATLSGRYATPDLYANQTDRITKLALPSNAATRAGVATVPAGTTVFTGKIAPQPLFDLGLIGGGNQAFIMGTLDNIQFKEISIQSLFKTKR